MKLIEKNNLVEEAYNQILRMIASQEWKEGDKLPSESQLCQAMGVSRNTVRAAMSQLIALGVLETRQGYGYCIRNLNTGIYLNALLPTMLLHSRELESIVEFRIGVESETAAMAALRATPEDIRRMETACEQAARSIDNPDEFAVYDMMFHRAVADASKNPMFIKTAELLESMYTVWLTGLLRTYGMERSHGYHKNICTAIEQGDSQLAKRYMTEHLQDVLHKVQMDSSRRDGAAAAGEASAGIG